jgi:hypothetical protein
LALIKAHNRLVALAREEGVAAAEVFERARRETIWRLYLASQPAWTPTLPARGQRFGLTDLLLESDAAPETPSRQKSIKSFPTPVSTRRFL